MKENKEWLVVGIITSPHGVEGKLRIKSMSDFKERFIEPGERWIQKDNQRPILYNLISGFQKPGKDLFIISLKEITTRDKAEKLINHKLLVKTNNIPELNEGEFHVSELLQMKVKIKIDNELKIIGEVCDLITENNQLILIKLYDNDKEVLVPFVYEIVPEIDKENHFLIINPPKGLLDL